MASDNSGSAVTTVRHVTADPSSLGLFGLAMITFVASSEKLGWTSGHTFVLPWALFLGASAQLIACIIDFKKNNIFGATAFGAYGLFWFSMAFVWMAKMGMLGVAAQGAIDGRQLGFAFVGFLFFSLYMTVAACETNKVLLAILVLIDVLFASLALVSFGIATHAAHLVAGWSEFIISIFGFYGAAGAQLNNQFGRKFIPMGGPMGIFKKA